MEENCTIFVQFHFFFENILNNAGFGPLTDFDGNLQIFVKCKK